MGVDNCVLGFHKELSFWLDIMKEHALFMRDGLKAERPDLAEKAENYRKNFSILKRRVDHEKHISSSLVDIIQSQTEGLLSFKMHVLELLVTCKTGRNGGSLYPLLVDHIAREAKQFLSILPCCRKTSHCDKNTTAELLVEKEVFWLRQMSDHAKFIRSLLDPSEREFVIQAQMWSDTFDRLYLQSKDIQSMLNANRYGFPTIARFTSDVVKQTKGLRDFKRASEKLLAECQVLSIISPLLADHVAREAEYFINVIQTIDLTAQGYHK